MKYKFVFVDVDGVLRNFIAKLREVFEREFPQEKILSEKEYDLRGWSTLGDKIFPWVVEGKAAKEIFMYAPPHEDALNALKEWLNQEQDSVKFAIITRQRNDRIQWTRTWLNQHGINGKIPIYYTIDKAGVISTVLREESEKNGETILPEKVVLIDDSPVELDNARLVGINAVCISRSWNEDWKGERISDLSEFNPFE